MEPSVESIVSALADDLPVGIWVARAPGGEFVYANRMFATLMGTGGIADAAVGGYAEPYGIFGRDGKPYPEDRMPFVRALQEKQVVVVDDIRIHRPDRSRINVRAFARPVTDAKGDVTHVVIAFFDITREVELAAERAQRFEREQRQQRLESIGTLAGGVAHDFNNLIFGIKLIASEVATQTVDPRLKGDIELIDNITERAATLTRSLLGFARMGRHRAAPVSLNEIIGNMRELLSRTLAGLQLEFHLDAKAGGVVVGDQAQLEQVVMNLVVNARDAVAGVGRVSVSTRTTEHSASTLGATAGLAPGPLVVFEVADNGPGIAPHDRDRIFEPYFTTKERGPDRGTGLGLATVMGIVESHQGAIELSAGIDGRGTTMRVYLPAAKAEATTEKMPPPRAALDGRGTVLVVDDDPLVRRALSSAIRSLGYEALEAATGEEAVELKKKHGARIGAVVLDLVMPGMSGRATYVALRAVAPDVRVLLMSGFTMNDEVQELLALGVRSFLSKPYSVDALARELKLLTT